MHLYFLEEVFVKFALQSSISLNNINDYKEFLLGEHSFAPTMFFSGKMDTSILANTLLQSRTLLISWMNYW